jgi:hypothetical protein
MKMKSAFFAVFLAASLVVPALAGNAPTVESMPEFSAADTQMLFEQDAMPMQLAALSDKEMRETEGAYWLVPVALWSIGGGVGGVVVNRWQTGSWTDSGRAFGAGATAGFWSSPLVRPLGPVITYGAGALGSGSWYRYLY